MANGETATYQGDIGPDGNLEPFRVEPRDKVSPKAIDILQRTPHIALAEGPEAQAVIIRSETKFKDPEAFGKFPALSYIARAGVGVDNIDMRLAAERGVATVNTPGASTDAVALRTMTLIQASAARLLASTKALQGHEWPRGRKDLVPEDLSEETLGVIGGCGRIGRRIRDRAADIFGRVLWSDVRCDEDGSNGVPIEQLLEESNVVAMAVSGKQEILTPALLAKIRDGALVVNTSRGTNINTEALLDHMRRRGLRAALDVYPDEGGDMFDKHPHLKDLVDEPGFLGTAHSAVSDPVTQRKLGEEAAVRIREYAQEGVINPYGLPGHTLPAVSLQDGHVPGVRAVLLHRSMPGMIERISHPIAQRGVNIHSFANGEGKDKLAATIVHMAGVDSHEALAIAAEIQKAVDPLRMRLLQFA